MGARSRPTYPARASQRDDWSTAGALASRLWLAARGVQPPGTGGWHAEVSIGIADERLTAPIDPATDTGLRVDIYSEEWGFVFCQAGRASWIRVTDIPFVHGRDDFALLELTPPLKELGTLVRIIERRQSLAFHREHAYVRTNIENAEPALRRWALSL
jgi:hypothetical protein